MSENFPPFVTPTTIQASPGYIYCITNGAAKDYIIRSEVMESV